MRRIPIVIGACLLFGSILIVPLILTSWEVPSDAKLARLGNIGQAYGILSVIFSGAALAAVALSIRYQAQQVRAERIENWRSAHADLLQLMMNEPRVYGLCAGDLQRGLTNEEYRQYLFTTIWLNFHRTGVNIGVTTEEGFRAETCADMFRSETARRLWRIRKEFLDVLPDVPNFYKMVDEEYEKAIARNSVNSDPSVIKETSSNLACVEGLE